MIPSEALKYQIGLLYKEVTTTRTRRRTPGGTDVSRISQDEVLWCCFEGKLVSKDILVF